MIYHKFQNQSKKIFFAALIYLVVFAANLLDESIPDEIYAIKGEENEIHFSVPVTVEKKEESVPVFFIRQNQTAELDRASSIGCPANF